ncbi:MAG: hypothetical protein IRZ28_13710 [Steroidobacteraceae bacterium]|nr:hypothetical protein [Steroidobacteraceae bacterium]
MLFIAVHFSREVTEELPIMMALVRGRARHCLKVEAGSQTNHVPMHERASDPARIYFVACPLHLAQRAQVLPRRIHLKTGHNRRNGVHDFTLERSKGDDCFGYGIHDRPEILADN